MNNDLEQKELFHLDAPIFAGVGYSDFQAHPLPVHEKPRSDWEHEINLGMEGKSRSFKYKIHADLLPRLFDDYKKHIDRIVSLGTGTYRTSLDFGRLCHGEGEFDEKMMSQYLQILAYAKSHGIEILLTLHHWPMPIWTAAYKGEKIYKGGWEDPNILKHFEFYVGKVGEFLFNKERLSKSLKPMVEAEVINKSQLEKIVEEGLVKRFITINEPSNYVAFPYIAGRFPPFRKLRIDLGIKVVKKIAKAHEIASNVLRKAAAKSEMSSLKNGISIGVAHNLIYMDSKGIRTPLTSALNYMSNWYFFDQFNNKDADFIGLQYYFRGNPLEQFRKKQSFKRIYSDYPEFGDVYPPGIEHSLKSIHKRFPQKPIIVSEIGFADRSDTRRPFWILETIRHALKAKSEGVVLDGIVLWSLINNLEWHHAMDMKFGIYDYLADEFRSDESGHISSRTAWQEISSYMQKPSEGHQKSLLLLYKKAKEQHDKAQRAIIDGHGELFQE